MTLPTRAVALALAVAMLGLAPQAPQGRRASGSLDAGSWPYLPGTAIRLGVDGFPGAFSIAVLGPGSVDGGIYRIPADAPPGDVTLAAANAFGLARRELRVAAAPDARTPAIAVASYQDGIALHDPQTFAIRGVLGIAGSASDVAFGGGRMFATDTQGTALTVTPLSPWNPATVDGVPFADEIAFDSRTGDTFVSNRDAGGSGALTRIARAGGVTRVDTGQTAEGLAVDERRGIVYVANVNDDTVAAVDATTMRVLDRFHAVARVFSLALSPDGSRLYAVSNQSASSPFGAAGRVVALALAPKPHVVLRSPDLTFPVGIALDAARQRLYVTDEESDLVDVLDARTLRAAHTPLATCRTPWKPLYDSVDGRLYVPCARADEVDVFDARTLRRVRGAPFATGGYPLAVAVWHPAAVAKPDTL